MANHNPIEFDQFIFHFANAVDGVDESAFRPETVLKEIEEWDSLAKLVTTVFVETEYEVELSSAQLEQCVTFQDITNLISSKLKTDPTTSP